MAKLMNWHLFEKKLKEKKIFLFTSLDVKRIFSISKIATTFLLHRYAKQGLIMRLKKGLYLFPEAGVPDFYIANKLYEPSYISLETALSYYGIIPETVYEITSVTTKATRRFKVKDKIFSYRSLKKEVFTGYSGHQQRGSTFLMAEPEKAFVDLCYLKMISNEKPLDRFSREKIKTTKTLRYAKLFNNKKLIKIIKALFQ